MWQNSGTDNVLFSSFCIKEVHVDAINGMLHLKGAVDRGYLDIVYENMFYSQLDENSVDMVIAMSEELSFSEFKTPRHITGLMRLLGDWDCYDDKFLLEIISRGHRIFTHYVDKTEEYIVIARRVLVISR